MKDTALFYATVTSVYADVDSETSGTTKVVKRDAYTVDITPTNSFRGPMINVPVTRLGAGGRNSTGVIMMPDVGDLVVCALIDGFGNFPVCLGSITNKRSQLIAKEGNERGDYTIKHSSGNYIQMRDSSVTIKHISGSSMTMNSSGDITIDSSSGVTVNSSSVVNVTSDNEVQVTASTVNVTASTEVNIKSSKINLGTAVVDYLLKGTAFKTFWDSIVSSHFHPTIFGPTGPSATLASPLPTTLLSTVIKTE